MPAESNDDRRRDVDLAAVLEYLGDLDELGRKFDEGQKDCQRMFGGLDAKIDDQVLPAIADLRRVIYGDPDDPHRFPGVKALVHDLHEVNQERVIRERLLEEQRARRRLRIGTATALAGTGLFGVLTWIVALLRQVVG